MNEGPFGRLPKLHMDNSSVEEFKLLFAACFFLSIIVSVVLFVISFRAPAVYRGPAVEFNLDRAVITPTHTTC